MKRRSGFTLVELVVVVLILGVIAAIAIPKLSQSVTSAGDNSAKTSLSTLRDTIDLYQSQHGGTLPGAAGDGTNAAGTEGAFTNQLTQYSNAAGVVTATKSAAFPFGPYLRKGFPKPGVGPLASSKNVKMLNAGAPLTGDAAPTQAWTVDYVSGEIIINSNAVSGDGTTTFDKF